MKTHLLLAFTLTCATLFVSPAFSQQTPYPSLISVSGSAEVKVAPDEIYLRVGVETRHENLEQAKQKNDASVSKALAFLNANNLESKDVQTDFVSVQPIYDDRNSFRTDPVAYLVRKSIEIKMTSIENFEAILTGLLSHGVNNVHGIEFRTSELRMHRDTARGMAIRAAKEKADALASELGVKCGKVHTINANEGGGWWNSGSHWGGRYGGGLMQNSVQNLGGAAETTDGALSVGQVSVSASVNVSFLIE